MTTLSGLNEPDERTEVIAGIVVLAIELNQNHHLISLQTETSGMDMNTAMPDFSEYMEDDILEAKCE